MKGWKDILVRTGKEFGEDHIAMISAGITFYTVLAIFPGLAALVGVYGLFADPSAVERNLKMLSNVLPEGALKLVGGQLQALVRADKAGLSASFALGLIASLWSANGAVKALMVGLNVAYGEHERRGFLKRTALSFAFTAGLLIFTAVASASLGLGPQLKGALGPMGSTLVEAVVWLVLTAMLGVGLALIYRYGPSRDPVRFQWISWGSAITLAVLIIFSIAFTAYVANFGRFNKVYGSLGAAVGFMMWIYLSAMVVLAGAELDAEIEHQTMVDTTEGSPRPLGQRGAKMADTVGRAT